MGGILTRSRIWEWTFRDRWTVEGLVPFIVVVCIFYDDMKDGK